MSTTKFVLNETSYFGNGAREVLAEEITKRGFKKVFLVSDKSLVGAGVAAKVEEELKKANIEYFKDLGVNIKIVGHEGSDKIKINEIIMRGGEK